MIKITILSKLKINLLPYNGGLALVKGCLYWGGNFNGDGVLSSWKDALMAGFPVESKRQVDEDVSAFS
jgi:hypothetical protein